MSEVNRGGKDAVVWGGCVEEERGTSPGLEAGDGEASVCGEPPSPKGVHWDHEPELWFGVPASAGESFDQSDAPELCQPCRLKAGLQTGRFMESPKGVHWDHEPGRRVWSPGFSRRGVRPIRSA